MRNVHPVVLRKYSMSAGRSSRSPSPSLMKSEVAFAYLLDGAGSSEGRAREAALRDFCVTLLCINGRCCANSVEQSAANR
jgi:hypothetical protein